MLKIVAGTTCSSGLSKLDLLGSCRADPSLLKLKIVMFYTGQKCFTGFKTELVHQNNSILEEGRLTTFSQLMRQCCQRMARPFLETKVHRNFIETYFFKVCFSVLKLDLYM